MTNDQREIHRKKRIIEYAERIGNVHKTCRYFGVAIVEDERGGVGLEKIIRVVDDVMLARRASRASQ